MPELQKPRELKLALVAGSRSMSFSGFTPFPEETAVVAYVDLLGFKEMVRSDPTGKVLIPVLERSIASGLAFTKLMRDTVGGVNYRIFSDNVCFWGNLDAGPLSFSAILSTVSEFQLQLALRGVFCRGGISIGYHYASDSILYGPALLEAVELEKVADYPRILLSPSILNHVDLISMAAFYYQLHKLGDEHWFVNYLWGIYFKEKENGASDLLFHQRAVSEALAKYAGIENVLRKYRWVRDYHNDSVSHLTFATEDMKMKEF